MKRKIFSIIAMVMIASMMLAGCGAKNETTPSVSAGMEDNDGKVTSLIFNSPDGAVDIQVTEYVGTLENGMVVYKSINTNL